MNSLNENEMVNMYKKMVYRFAHKWQREPMLSFDDLVSVGNMAIINAARKWKEDKGATFTTYVYRAIQTAIWGYAKANRYTLKCCPNQQTNPENIKYADKQQKHLISVDTAVDDQSSLGFLPASGTDPIENAEMSEEWETVLGAAEKLDGRERFIFFNSDKWFGEMSLREIGERFGVTKERVRQIEAKILLKLGDIVRGEVK